MQPIEKAKKVAELMDDKKANTISILEVGEMTSIADYFVIGEGSSTLQVRAIADEIEEKMAELGYQPLHVEGYSTATWILLDYGDVVAHVFHSETRHFYDIERLWTDAPKIKFGVDDK